MKFGSVIDAGSIGPLPLRTSSSFKNGVIKSARTPSISSPNVIAATIYGKIHFSVNSDRCYPRRQCATKNFPFDHLQQHLEGERNGRGHAKGVSRANRR